MSEQLSGFGHNAVTPIGMKTRMCILNCLAHLFHFFFCESHLTCFVASLNTAVPIIMSEQIVKLKEDGLDMWLGGGEFDVKWRVPVDEFVRVFQPVIIGNISDLDE